MNEAPRLSVNTLSGKGTCTPSSTSIKHTESSSYVAVATARYLASMVDRATVGCFLESQETRVPPT